MITGRYSDTYSDQYETGPQEVWPSGIPSDSALGTFAVSRAIRTTSITPVPVFGVPKLSRTSYLAGISSSQVFGTTLVKITTYSSGIPSTGAVGTPSLSRRISVPGISSLFAAGVLATKIRLSLTGLVTSQALGSLVISIVRRYLFISSIDTEEGFGLLFAAYQGLVAADGIETAESVQIPSVTLGTAEILPIGVESEEIFEAPSLIQQISSVGFDTGEVIPQPTLGLGLGSVLASGIDSASSVSMPVLATFAAIVLGGMVSAFTIGQQSIAAGMYRVFLNAIWHESQFGSIGITFLPYRTNPTYIYSGGSTGYSIISHGGAMKPSPEKVLSR